MPSYSALDNRRIGLFTEMWGKSTISVFRKQEAQLSQTDCASSAAQLHEGDAENADQIK